MSKFLATLPSRMPGRAHKNVEGGTICTGQSSKVKGKQKEKAVRRKGKVGGCEILKLMGNIVGKGNFAGRPVK